MFNTILVVCVGNICRSPTAEKLLQLYLPNKQVISAGIANAKSGLTGKGIEPNALALLEEREPQANTEHSAQQLSSELVRKADLILVMENGHLNVVNQKYPQASGKCMLLGKWDSDAEVPDPYQKSDEAFQFAYDEIERHCRAWAQKL
ncbi:phosphotyrosine protein phosphatase [Paraferrimonas sedimenticola]|uniref:protein-tyrosine-phosphatase n=1 Tax=Paraferrimonas sedimenticola TaxID=375674 RepID=A0AA37RXJ3_9GAMM|nr:phosphotyrosine protein phosphatase [Paraferrimonas sedimenticola]GLP96893.1 phosphatase [Paraferrimonas sedimenticola]